MLNYFFNTESSKEQKFQQQLLGKHAEGKGSVVSRWEDGLCNGPMSALNPQIAATFPGHDREGKVVFTLSVPDSDGRTGIVMYVYKTETPERFFEKKHEKPNLVAKSQFLRDTSVTCTLDLSTLSSSRTCVVLLCSENTSFTKKFSLSTALENSKPKADMPTLTVLPMQTTTVCSRWTKELCDGYNRILNPQISIRVSQDQNVLTYISLKKCSKNNDGIAWIVYENLHSTGRLLERKKEDLVGKSSYRSGCDSISSTIKLEKDKNYVLLACLEKFSEDLDFLVTFSTALRSTSSEETLSVRDLPRVRASATCLVSKSTSYGPYSFAGPQILLQLPKTSSDSESLITMRREDGDEAFNTSGIRFCVYEHIDSKPNASLRVIDAPHMTGIDSTKIAAKSKFVLNSSVSCNMTLKAYPVQYTMVPLLQNIGATGTIVLETEVNTEKEPVLRHLGESVTASVEGSWTINESGGVQSLSNPQIYVKARRGSTQLALELHRISPDKLHGIRIVVYSTKTRVISNEEETIVAKSSFAKASMVSVVVPITDQNKRKFVAVVEMGYGGTTGSFALLAQNTASKSKAPAMALLPTPHCVQLDGSWKGGTAAGYRSPKNPQFELRCDRETWVSVSLEVPWNTSEQRKQPMGIRVDVYKGAKQRFRRARRHLDKKSLVGASKFVASTQVEVVVKNLTVCPDSPYIILPCTETKGSAHEAEFTLKIRSGEPVSVEPLPGVDDEEKPTESDCSDVLTAFQSFAPDDESVHDNDQKYWRRCTLYKKNPLKAIEAYCIENNCMFIDSEFKPCDSALNSPEDYGIGSVKAASWNRLSSIRDDPVLFHSLGGCAIDPNDVVQGGVGDCWLLQAISSIATRGEMLRNMLEPTGGSACGAYSLRLYDSVVDKWRFLIVDDYIPINARGHPAFARSRDPDECWVSLIEKAFAKLHSCYQFLKGSSPFSMSVGDALNYMTSGDTIDLHIKDTGIDTMWDSISSHLEMQWLAGCGTRGAKDPKLDGIPNQLGIVPMHAYSILAAKVVTRKGRDVRLLQLRNTWGHSEWTGRWSDKSRHWDEKSRRIAGWMDLDDGIFFMQIEDFAKNFENAYLCRILDDVLPNHEIVKGVFSAHLHEGPGSIQNPQVEIGMNLSSVVRIEVLVPRSTLKKLAQGVSLVIFKAPVDKWGERITEWDSNAVYISSAKLVKSKRVAVIETQLKRSTDERYVAVVLLDRQTVLDGLGDSASEKRRRRATADVPFTLVLRSDDSFRLQRLDANAAE